MVRFYDEIELEPVKLLTDICQFLEIDQPSEQMKKLASEKINAAKEFEIPKLYKKFLYDLYKEQMGLLSDRYHSYARAWIAEYRQDQDEVS